MTAQKLLRSKAFIKFIFFGTLLTLTSQSILLILLLIFPVGISTALTQILHNYLGYITYKHGVFKREGKPFAYILLVILSWAMQTLLLETIPGKLELEILKKKFPKFVEKLLKN